MEPRVNRIRLAAWTSLVARHRRPELLRALHVVVIVVRERRPRRRLQLVGVRGRIDRVRDLVRDRPRDRGRSPRSARAAPPALVGTRSRPLRRRDRRDLRSVRSRLRSAAAAEPEPRAGAHADALGAAVRGRVRGERRALHGRRAARRGADVPRARPVAASLPRTLAVDPPRRRRVRRHARLARGAAHPRAVRHRARVSCATAPTASIRGWSCTRCSTARRSRSRCSSAQSSSRRSRRRSPRA